jgi:hypothetical protein
MRASDSAYTSTRFFFREHSKTANTTTRLDFYETYYLPIVNDDRTDNASYNILTTKDLSFSITGNAATATKLSTNASNTTASFWRGDNTWSSTLTGSITISKAGECGLEVTNSQATNPN